MKDKKKLLILIATVVLAIILFILAITGIKYTHISGQTDTSMSLIFGISLMVAIVSYVWTVCMTIAIIDIVVSGRRKKQ